MCIRDRYSTSKTLEGRHATAGFLPERSAERSRKAVPSDSNSFVNRLSSSSYVDPQRFHPRLELQMGHSRSVPKKARHGCHAAFRPGRPVGHHLHAFILIGNLKVATNSKRRNKTRQRNINNKKTGQDSGKTGLVAPVWRQL